jgi:hypothetical protein
VRLVTADRERVFTNSYTFTPTVAEAAFVTAPFTLSDASTVEIGLGATLNNSWLGFDLALVNLETGDAFNVEDEISYYHGVEGGESWTEGSTTSSRLLRAVPAGQYYLRVEPEGPVNGPAVPFTIRVRRDVPSILPYALGLFLLSIPVLVSAIRYASFESRRMQESDYGSSGDSEDDDDE